MNNRIQNAFKNGKAFIGFVTGGDPSIEKTEAFVHAMLEGGCDLIEIGVPFSDPIAEGPVIQRANERALKAGASLKKLFALVKHLRETVSVPVVFLTYLNPVFRYEKQEGSGDSAGYEAFFLACASSGVDGVIIPDLPFEEQGAVKPYALKNGVSLISLAAPTSGRRIAEIARNADGFLYMVSSMGVTGVRGEIKTDLKPLIAEIKKNASVPVAVGFGVNTPAQASEIARIADGVIVGSAIVKIVEEHGEKSAQYIREYVQKMKSAVSSQA
ncbi:MAG: tryptophan synthase subunit alpha [Spirochaetaceae bacterium]|jgi:tryptophan synthase alpha chain|nr:tryptophan synthase subunit alpha [Spirochaetaceae bacterium]